MDGGAWKATVHRVAKSRTRFSDFTFTFPFHVLEKEMATHSSILAWEIPWTEEPGRLQSIGSQRVEHDLVTKLNQNQILLHENKVGGLTIRFFLKQFLLSLNVVFVFDPSH